MRVIFLFSLFTLFIACEESTVELGGKLKNTVSTEFPVSDEGEEDVVQDDPAETTTNACNKSQNLSNIVKPKGAFTSKLTTKAVTNSTLKGGLVRITWAELETSPGVFDFTKIEDQLALLPNGKKWSLGIHGGYAGVDESDPDLYSGTNPDGSARLAVNKNFSPQWLIDQFNVETFEMEILVDHTTSPFKYITAYMPKYWNTKVQERLSMMLNEVANRYKNDSKLQLVYVPQMTTNGIEGHFNGIDHNTLLNAAGIDTSATDAYEQFENIWSEAALETSLSVINAFPNQAVAFEVHEILGRIEAPKMITQEFINNSIFQNRAGAALWWLTNDSNYQPELLEYLKNYTGDLYGQVIANSSQTNRIPAGTYPEVLEIAKTLCMRYVEPWNYEFDNNTYDEAMRDFNTFADESFE